MRTRKVIFDSTFWWCLWLKELCNLFLSCELFMAKTDLNFWIFGFYLSVYLFLTWKSVRQHYCEDSLLSVEEKSSEMVCVGHNFDSSWRESRANLQGIEISSRSSESVEWNERCIDLAWDRVIEVYKSESAYWCCISKQRVALLKHPMEGNSSWFKAKFTLDFAVTVRIVKPMT